MTCHGCASKFSVFLREQSCPKCAFSYCNKCLSKKVALPEKGTKLLKVCDICYVNTVSNVQDKASAIEMEPPQLLLKRLENLENPARPPITLFKKENKLQALKRGLSTEDRAIADRLQKLKEERLSLKQVPPSEDDIRRRLAVLQGKPEGAQGTSNVPKADLRSDQQRIEDLLMEYVDETSLPNVEKERMDDLEARIMKLKGLDASGTTLVLSDSELDETAIIRKALEEARLEEDLDGMQMDMKGGDWEPSNEVLPWCCICNEDASTQCPDCDGNLYCSLCFKEVHDDLGENHRPVPFTENH